VQRPSRRRWRVLCAAAATKQRRGASLLLGALGRLLLGLLLLAARRRRRRRRRLAAHAVAAGCIKQTKLAISRLPNFNAVRQTVTNGTTGHHWRRRTCHDRV